MSSSYNEMSSQNDDTFEYCDDGSYCLNGSQCVQTPNMEGTFYCDCDEAFYDAAYAGLKCEHKATTYCVVSGIHYKNFCTNGGECAEIVGPDSEHPSCICNDNYEGEHCQFVKGTKPIGWPYNDDKNTASGSSGMGGGTIAGIVISTVVIAIAIGVLAAAIYIKRLRKDANSDDIKPTKSMDGLTGRDLNLEEDGGTMKDAISPSKTALMDDEDDGVSYANTNAEESLKNDADLSIS